ncbi:U5 snRNP complex subunit [Aspergillus terreus]|uniref:U5 snRNP complex subunit n=1 Tax=Aspergillus terreus TaxID=33178 RepID=A0A5M3YP70_ASPTE|nr:hypothetical protein ATETN484_0001100800 [Aspergillus terreus]GFF12863.1 U5 snRNP complex subunit [Aspergillus terreus]
MVSALLSRPRLAHSNPSRTLIGPLLSANPNNESSHHPTIDTAAGTHAFRRTYVPINPESASGPHNRRGDTAHVRRSVITLIISTIFLILVLGLYLAFAISGSPLEEELHILLIFMILILSIVWCHSLIRFSLAFLRGPATNRIPSRAGPNGYAQPERPIPVTFIADEEMMTGGNGEVQEKVTAPPPAYGLWRSTVRINPDLLYWQRVDESTSRSVPRSNSIGEDSGSKPTSPRPPSYTSDNGIDYAVEAQPRSFTRWPVPEESGRR